MRVGLLIYGSLDTLSGGYLYDRNMVSYLESQGDSVTIISIPWKNYLVHLGQNFNLVLFQRLLNLEVDVLIQDELNHPSLALLNRRLRNRVSYPIISLVHHLRSSEPFSQPAAWFYQSVEKAYLRSVDAFIYNSQTTQKAVETLSGCSKPGVVAYPSGTRFGDSVSQEEIHQRAYLNPLQILFVGNLIPRKGLHTLIRALTFLPSNDWRLKIVGDSRPDPVYVEEAWSLVTRYGLSGQVQFLGMVQDKKLADLYRKAHILAVPSLYEGFGIVYLEAMAFGVVPIATEVGGAVEIINDGEDGFLVKVEDSQFLANQINAVIKDRDRLAQMGFAATRKFANFPSWPQTGETIRKFLENQVKNEQSSS